MIRLFEIVKDYCTDGLEKRTFSTVSLLLSVLLVCSVSSGVDAAEISSGVVTRVIDGDSLVIRAGAREFEARLWGIDSPEYDQPGAPGSRKALEDMVLGHSVAWEIKYTDRYGRAIIVLYAEGKNINEAMVANGSSWVYGYFCREPVCRSWQQLELQARQKGSGLWSLKNPTPPWQWKRKR